MPLKEMREAGITIALGTDSVASSNNLDLFEEMKFAALLHKHHYWEPRMANAQDVLDMATRNGAEVLGTDEIGRLEEGKLADIITLDIGLHLKPRSPNRALWRSDRFSQGATLVLGLPERA